MTVEQAKAIIAARQANPEDRSITYELLVQALAVLAGKGLKAR